jgi:hypothetical protein
MRTEELVNRADALITKGDGVIATYEPSPPGFIGFTTLDSGAFTQWQSQSLTFLINVLGPNHVYVTSFKENVEAGHESHVKAGQGILRALWEDIDQGYLFEIRTLVTAEVFTDFVEMAQHLLESGYKDPAASLTGAVLEDGLRKIAAKNNIKLKSREDLGSLNAKLADASVYTRLVQKKVAVWTDVRNHADHAQFAEYSESDVNEMLKGVTEFLSVYLT